MRKLHDSVVPGPDTGRSRSRQLRITPGRPATHGLSLFEADVPREGGRVTRSYQFTRWLDVSSHAWVGRRKGVGRGEGSSGLQFDSLHGKE